VCLMTDRNPLSPGQNRDILLPNKSLNEGRDVSRFADFEKTDASEKLDPLTGEKELVLSIENSLEDRMQVLQQMARLKAALKEARKS